MNVRRVLETATYPLLFAACVVSAVLIDKALNAASVPRASPPPAIPAARLPACGP